MTEPTIYPETEGYFCIPGFVKNNPLNNIAYLEMYKDDPWYDVLKKIDHDLEALCPGYNIAQIKQKFGELRYYVSQGNCPDEVYDYRAMNTIINRYAEELS